MKKLLENYRYPVDFSVGVLCWRGKPLWIETPTARVTLDLIAWMLELASDFDDTAELSDDEDFAWRLRAQAASLRNWADNPNGRLIHEVPEIATRQVWQPYRVSRADLDQYLEHVVLAARKPTNPVPEFLIMADLAVPEISALERVKQIAVFCGAELIGKVVSTFELGERIRDLGGRGNKTYYRYVGRV